MKILIIEDESKTADYLAGGLGEAGYTVDCANNGIDGLHLAKETSYDLILLDVMLPGLDGWTVMRKLREQARAPVLFLSAKGNLEDRLRGLELGAEEYLVKPFSFAELLARIRIILRRGQEQPAQDVLALGDLRVDIAKHRCERGGVRIALTNKEFKLLVCFLQHPEQVLSRTFLASRVWDMNFDSDTNVVDVAVRRLRQKVDEPFPLRLIHTVHGVGYRCELPA
ncbi:MULTISPECIES: heavy metal response regulator transcription factor [unclassified Achromobacter]|uniref:heavy metal response regulator transcription factor n=1 Tax=unclassified Achromobacter TaxID=2626865 RepID=UPI000B517DB6|nr:MULTISPECIES: heavy metal response regulator transcription factor [unclassified Achromobacter]OWT74469.1 DNA-binding response regulator [Achromobacter sp. HZ34]OWT78936.1 DNA-binding response regulator [Achromobacter sp. HZ28]